ncbi:YfbU family protein [Bacteroides fragilis]|nr:YfbU family protein [Bacteroides fragilis]
METIILSTKERLQLSFQLEILEALYPENREYRNYRIAIENGYTHDYQNMFRIIQDEMPERECQKVLSILNMYRTIIYSYANLKKKNAIKELTDDDVRFPGFDNQEEESQLLYAEYCLDTLKKYPEIKKLSHGNYDSHCSMMNKYEKMLSIWTAKYGITKNNLSESEIRELLDKE